MRSPRDQAIAEYLGWPIFLGIAGMVLAMVVGFVYPLLAPRQQGEEPALGQVFMMFFFAPIGLTLGMIVGLVVAEFRSKHFFRAAPLYIGVLLGTIGATVGIATAHWFTILAWAPLGVMLGATIGLVAAAISTRRAA